MAGSVLLRTLTPALLYRSAMGLRLRGALLGSERALRGRGVGGRGGIPPLIAHGIGIATGAGAGARCRCRRNTGSARRGGRRNRGRRSLATPTHPLSLLYLPHAFALVECGDAALNLAQARKPLATNAFDARRHGELTLTGSLRRPRLRFHLGTLALQLPARICVAGSHRARSGQHCEAEAEGSPT